MSKENTYVVLDKRFNACLGVYSDKLDAVNSVVKGKSYLLNNRDRIKITKFLESTSDVVGFKCKVDYCNSCSFHGIEIQRVESYSELMWNSGK